MGEESREKERRVLVVDARLTTRAEMLCLARGDFLENVPVNNVSAEIMYNLFTYLLCCISYRKYRYFE